MAFRIGINSLKKKYSSIIDTNYVKLKNQKLVTDIALQDTVNISGKTKNTGKGILTGFGVAAAVGGLAYFCLTGKLGKVKESIRYFKLKLKLVAEDAVKLVKEKAESKSADAVEKNAKALLTPDSAVVRPAEEIIERLPDRHGIVPITSYEEYCDEFEKIKNFVKRDECCGILTGERRGYPIIRVSEPVNINKFKLTKHISEVPIELRGLFPYCGNDVSSDINYFLRMKENIYMPMVKDGTNYCCSDFIQGRQLIHMDSDKAKEFIRCLDYSMEQCNKRYGTHRGLVYRGGFFSPDGGMYYSTSLHPADVNVRTQSGRNYQFHIIKTTKGTKINEFQKEFNNGNWSEEEEILLPRDTKYREISETSEFDEEKLNFAKKILEHYDEINQICREHKHGPQYTESLEEILKKIYVWEEV